MSFFNKGLIIKELENPKDKKAIFNVFFRQFYDLESKRFNYVNLGHLIIRAINFFLLSLLIIYAAHFAHLGNINFGIVTSCLCVAIPFNCLFSYIFWKEKMNKKMMVGTLLILAGVSWVALSKGRTNEVITNERAE